jgi:hypothetical protein
MSINEVKTEQNKTDIEIIVEVAKQANITGEIFKSSLSKLIELKKRSDDEEDILQKFCGYLYYKLNFRYDEKIKLFARKINELSHKYDTRDQKRRYDLSNQFDFLFKTL